MIIKMISEKGDKLSKYTENPIIQGFMTEQQSTLLMHSVAYDGKIKINAYPCEALPILCSAIIKARRLKQPTFLTT